MYMKSINDLKTELMFELQKANNSKSTPEIFGVQLQHTQWPNIITCVVQFKDEKGYAVAMLKTDDHGTWQLLAPFDVKINKEEKKK